MKAFHEKLRILPIAVLAMGMGTRSFAAEAADHLLDSEQVSELLSQVKTHAFQLKEDAGTLESFTHNVSLSWQSHAAVLTRMKEDINEAGRDLTKLEEAKKSGAPWQKTAIERIHPLLRELAGNTEKAINYGNENQKRLFTEPYKDYLEANADLSSELASTISDFVDYGNTKDRLEALERKLELPAKR
jgi:DNA repair exonuclease SbcCD nuclease subunit